MLRWRAPRCVWCGVVARRSSPMRVFVCVRLCWSAMASTTLRRIALCVAHSVRTFSRVLRASNQLRTIQLGRICSLKVSARLHVLRRFIRARRLIRSPSRPRTFAISTTDCAARLSIASTLLTQRIRNFLPPNTSNSLNRHGDASTRRSSARSFAILVLIERHLNAS